ncbi:hypothetical protein EOM27_01660 [Candidatus Saccharibacteria bacterium]|nr:hypothetical protein [Candidatus Saccharibacteria bacterium]
MKKSHLVGKKILITHSALRLLAGSEIVVLELAEYLQSIGMEVIVYTNFFSDPIKFFYDKKLINVVTDESEISINNFDYVWVNHQTLPPNFLDNFNSDNGPIFIFLHMSELIDHFLEQPYIWELEKKLSSKSLFITPVSLENNKLIYGGRYFSQPDLYRNPAPISFCRYNHTSNRDIKNILVVSNHPPDDLTSAINILNNDGINVDIMGEKGNKYTLVEPSIFKGYDAVISIGKTVQYCLCSNTPVFIYDKFGGPGYLNKDNIKLAMDNNFSGRGFAKYSSEEIATMIVDGYKEARLYQKDNTEYFLNEFSIEKVVNNIFNNIQKTNNIDISKKYAHYLKSTLTMMKWKFVEENRIKNIEKEMYDVKNYSDELKHNINDIVNSKSFRIGQLIAKPYRRLIKLLR